MVRIINARETPAETNNLYVWAGPFRSEKSALDRARRVPYSVVIFEPESPTSYAHWYVCNDYPKGGDAAAWRAAHARVAS